VEEPGDEEPLDVRFPVVGGEMVSIRRGKPKKALFASRRRRAVRLWSRLMTSPIWATEE
jgi:hypothetical protein